MARMPLFESPEQLGVHGPLTNRVCRWRHRFRRRRIRYERRADIHHAFLSLACSLICWRYVGRICWALLKDSASD
ncbi:hypothetical protein F0185_30155 [Massilia sp. CCM 8692]|uniref:Transposase n=1 Tax=Massilia rubra TaxID=2607910 RepID=A0ABX0LZV4_9BURK|nr:hypothetical protein [Massilia rubra]